MATVSNKLSDVPKPTHSDRIASDANLLYVSKSVGNVKQATLVDMVYPVGSIYISVNTTNPGTLFGGTWEQIKDRFLLAAGDSYAAGSTGGEAQHTLTEAEMPSHTHFSNDGWNGYAPRSNRDGVNNVLTYSKVKSAGGYTKPYTDANNGLDSTLSSTGKNQPHNNMPPYLAVYMWKRTA